MPFFVVDDGAHSHPKFMRATNAAVGLWMRVGSYVAQHLTDGHVPGTVAHMYGTAPQIRKLITVGLWHEQGHVCPRCPAVRPGDFFMHDYKESGNPSRAEVLQRRAKGAEKKRKYRAAHADRSPDRTLFDDEPGADRDGFEDDSMPDERYINRRNISDDAGQDDASPVDSPGTSRARAPLHSTPLLKEGAEEREVPTGSSARAHEPTLSLITADWAPSTEDVRAAQLARTAAGRNLLTEQQLAAVTRKFVRRQLDNHTRAAAWGGRWQQWAENERPAVDPPAGGVVVPFDQQQPTKGQKQREGLARLLHKTGEV